MEIIGLSKVPAIIGRITTLSGVVKTSHMSHLTSDVEIIEIWWNLERES